MARLNEPRVHADVTNLCTSMNYYETEQDAKATPTEHQIAAVRRLLLHLAGPWTGIDGPIDNRPRPRLLTTHGPSPRTLLPASANRRREALSNERTAPAQREDEGANGCRLDRGR